MPPTVPPIKCQGIKTKLLPMIQSSIPNSIQGRWIEPFCGSGVVALNVKPEQAVLGDSNPHIIRFYQRIQDGSITPRLVAEYLKDEGALLARMGEDRYYQVRERFNRESNPLDFLFLNRACFNGVMRFNKKGAFNVPFCRKPDRFAQAYVTKICNQVRKFSEMLEGKRWEFVAADFRETLNRVRADDFVYIDPPYAGRHVDYYNNWSESDEAELAERIRFLSCRVLVSTWWRNEYRSNSIVEAYGNNPKFQIRAVEHFYHVGSTEDLRNSMTEALISNYPVEFQPVTATRQSGFLFDEPMQTQIGI